MIKYNYLSGGLGSISGDIHNNPTRVFCNMIS